jgi:hypothetical protein
MTATAGWQFLIETSSVASPLPKGGGAFCVEDELAGVLLQWFLTPKSKSFKNGDKSIICAFA